MVHTRQVVKEDKVEDQINIWLCVDCEKVLRNLLPDCDPPMIVLEKLEDDECKSVKDSMSIDEGAELTQAKSRAKPGPSLWCCTLCIGIALFVGCAGAMCGGGSASTTHRFYHFSWQFVLQSMARDWNRAHIKPPVVNVNRNSQVDYIRRDAQGHLAEH